MSDIAIQASRGDTSQSLLRVWLAISAVWIVFWMLIAAVVLATGEFDQRLGWDLRPFALILVVPPIGVFLAGTICRWGYLGLFAGPRRQGRVAASCAILSRATDRSPGSSQS